MSYGRHAPDATRCNHATTEGKAVEQSGATAVIVSRDDAHSFLLETLLDGSIDHVVHVDGVDKAVDLAMRGLDPALVLLDVDLVDDDDAAAAAAARLRIVCDDAVVLEVGERLERSGEDLADRLRGNSVEAHDWLELRR